MGVSRDLCVDVACMVAQTGEGFMIKTHNDLAVPVSNLCVVV